MSIWLQVSLVFDRKWNCVFLKDLEDYGKITNKNSHIQDMTII